MKNLRIRMEMKNLRIRFVILCVLIALYPTIGVTDFVEEVKEIEKEVAEVEPRDHEEEIAKIKGFLNGFYGKACKIDPADYTSYLTTHVNINNGGKKVSFS